MTKAMTTMTRYNAKTSSKNDTWRQGKTKKVKRSSSYARIIEHKSREKTAAVHKHCRHDFI